MLKFTIILTSLWCCTLHWNNTHQYDVIPFVRMTPTACTDVITLFFLNQGQLHSLFQNSNSFLSYAWSSPNQGQLHSLFRNSDSLLNYAVSNRRLHIDCELQQPWMCKRLCGHKPPCAGQLLHTPMWKIARGHWYQINNTQYIHATRPLLTFNMAKQVQC